jgi:hypothetical protein
MYPNFYDEIPTVVLQDDLANFLGSVDNGIIVFSYFDVVKVAGHSCPTVLGTYMMIQKGLSKLYQGEIARRGEILIEFKENQTDGVVGVMANIATAITGATSDFGFKGLGGKFSRCSLMEFQKSIDGIMKITRIDTNQSVVLNYDTSSLQRSPMLNQLMQKSLQGKASNEERKEFSSLWQKGVENIFRNIDDFIQVK